MVYYILSDRQNPLLVKVPFSGRDDCVITPSYVGGSTFGQIMGLILIMYHTDFPGTLFPSPHTHSLY